MMSFQTRVTAAEVEKRMNAEGHKCVCLTGDFDGRTRDIVIDAFREGKAKVLITTNVLSRGIDVQSVSLVVNYVSTSLPLAVWLSLLFNKNQLTDVVFLGFARSWASSAQRR